MKKIIYFIATFLLCTVYGFSQGTTLSLGSTTASAGDTILVPIDVTNFSNVGSVFIKVSYNKAVLEFITSVNAPADFLSSADNVNGVATISWLDLFGTSPLNISSGKLLDLKFVSKGGASDLLFSTVELTDELANNIPFTSSNGKVNSSVAPKLTLATITAAPNSNVSVAVSAENLTNIGSVSLKIEYDPNVLTFASVSNAPEGVTFDATTAGGVLTLGWFSASTEINITDGKLVDLNFAYINGSSDLKFQDANCEISDSAGTAISDVNYFDGKVSSNVTPPTLTIGTVTAAPNSNVNVAVTAENLVNIGSVSLKIDYDPNVLTFSNVTNAPAGVTFDATVAGGVLTLGWFSASTEINITSGKLVDLNFAYINGSSDLKFQSANCEVSDSAGAAISGVNYVDGKVSSSVTPPTLTIGTVTAAPNTNVSVAINAENLVNVGSVSLKIEYNTSALTFTGVSNTPEGVTFDATAAGGVLTLGWFSASTEINITSGKLIDLNFAYTSGSSDLKFKDADCEISDSAGAAISGVSYVDGGVSSSVTPPTLTIATVTAAPNTNVSVAITAENLVNVGSVSLKIDYDPGVLTFSNVTNAPAGVTFDATVAGGVLTLGWFSASTEINITSGKLVDLNFAYGNGSSDLKFQDANCEISDSAGSTISGVNYVDGGVSSGAAPKLTIATTAPLTNTNISVAIAAENLVNVGSVSLKIEYDPTILTFSGVSNPPAGVTFDATVSGSLITIGWFSASSEINITNGKLLDLNFAYTSGISPVTFIRTECEITNSLAQAITNVIYVDGKVSGNRFPSFTAVIGNITIKEADTLTFTYAATDLDGDPLTYNRISSPTGSTFDPATRVFRWVPSYIHASATPYTVIIGVTDGKGTVIRDTSKIKVDNRNRPPSITEALKDTTIEVGDTLIYQYRGIDLDGTAGLEWGLKESVAGAQINATTGRLRFIPPNSGTFILNVYLTDKIDTVSHTSTINVVVGVETEPGIPDKYSLSQNYPNPFNPATKIKFGVPQESFVSLKIFNLLGEEVATVVNETLSAGSYRYDFNASSLTSGIYIYRIQAGDFISTKKMTLIK